MENIEKKLKISLVENADTAILILPGGAYRIVSDTEGECVANKFNDLNCSSFTLKYSVFPKHYPTALLEVASAIKFIRQNYLTIKKVIVCGFSAGGHLAGSIATLFDDKIIHNTLGAFNYRPDGIILSYPVITYNKEYRHNGSFINLCGVFNFSLKRELSLETRVNSNTPPTFIWHTEADTAVPYQNSVLMAEALKKNNVPFFLKLFPLGRHGLSLATPESGNALVDCFHDVATWPTLALEWLTEFI